MTSNPIPVKAALEMLGIIEGHLRLPMVPASRAGAGAVRTALERQALVAGGTTCVTRGSGWRRARHAG